MKKLKFNIRIIDILLLTISLLFLFGMLFVFTPCGPKEDGSFMSCHWAGNTINGIAAVLTVISAVHLFVSDKGIKTGISVSVIVISFFTVLIPNKIIAMCMMRDMRCHAVMTPGAVICSILMIAVALLDIILLCKRS